MVTAILVLCCLNTLLLTVLVALVWRHSTMTESWIALRSQQSLYASEYQAKEILQRVDYLATREATRELSEKQA